MAPTINKIKKNQENVDEIDAVELKDRLRGGKEFGRDNSNNFRSTSFNASMSLQQPSQSIANLSN